MDNNVDQTGPKCRGYIKDYFCQEAWTNPVTEKCTFTNKELQKEALGVITCRECGYKEHLHSKLWWNPKACRNRKRSNDTVQEWFCTYRHQSKCHYRVKMIRDNETGLNRLYLPNPKKAEHADHLVNFFKLQPPKQIFTVISSPSDAKNIPSRLVRKNLKNGVCLTTDDQTKASRALAKHSRAIQLRHLINGGNSGGA